MGVGAPASTPLRKAPAGTQHVCVRGLRCGKACAMWAQVGRDMVESEVGVFENVHPSFEIRVRVTDTCPYSKRPLTHEPDPADTRPQGKSSCCRALPPVFLSAVRNRVVVAFRSQECRQRRRQKRRRCVSTCRHQHLRRSIPSWEEFQWRTMMERSADCLFPHIACVHVCVCLCERASERAHERFNTIAAFLHIRRRHVSWIAPSLAHCASASRGESSGGLLAPAG